MPSTQELFGDDSSAEEEEEEEERQVSTAKPSNNEDSHEKNDLSDDDEDAPAPKPPKPAEPEDTITYANDDAAWSIPTFPSPHNNNNNNNIQPLVLKLPNFMGIQTQPFTVDDYDPTQEQEYFGPQSVWNLMRYRYHHAEDAAATATNTRESNTRLVEWDDGSYTLHIGAEAFTIDLMDNTMRQSTTDSPDNTTHDTSSFPGLNGYLYVSHKASMGNNNRTTTTLECVHPLRARGTIQPTSLQSAAHKALTVSIRQQTITKRAKIANYQTTQDPEKLKQERIKVKQDLEKAHVARGERRSGGPRSRPRRSRAYMEEDEDDEEYDTTNIKAMKRRTYKDDDDEDGDDDFGNDDDDDDDEEEDEGDTFHRVRPHKKQARVEETKKDKAGLFDDDDDEDGDDDDDDDLVRPVVKTSNKRNTQSLFDDDDDSE